MTMSISTIVENALSELPTPQPTFALVFHKIENYHFGSNNKFEITQHGIVERKNKNHLCAGKTFTYDDLDALVSILKNAKSGRERTLIPENVLLQGVEELAWVVPSAVRLMWFELKDKENIKLKVPWPTLLFHVRGSRLRIVALGKKTRPSVEDTIYHAPLMNVSADGSVCTGTYLPPGCLFEHRSGWENVIFHTFFSHTNQDHTLRVKEDAPVDDMAHIEFWHTLEETQTQHFPKKSLQRMKSSLGQFLAR